MFIERTKTNSELVYMFNFISDVRFKGKQRLSLPFTEVLVKILLLRGELTILTREERYAGTFLHIIL